MPWGLLRPLGAWLGLLGTLLGLPRDPLGSDPWIRSMVLFDLKRKIDFLMSFRDFAELSFFSRASGDNFLRSFFLTFWYHLETLRSYPFFLVPPGITFCAFSFLFFEDVFFISKKWWLVIDDWWLIIDHGWLMIDNWWLMTDDWWLMIDEWWVMIDDWW